MGIGLGLVAVGLVAGIAAWLVDRRRRIYSDQPTTPAAAVFAGHNEVSGKASAAEPTISKRTNTPSVWWTYVLEEERTHTRTVTDRDSDGNTRTRTETYQEWHTIDRKSADLGNFEVVDDSGSVRVRTRGAKIVPRQLFRDTFRREKSGGFLARMVDSATGRYRETENAIAIDDQLFVAGTARMDAKSGVPYLTQGDSGPFLISTKSEEAHIWKLGFMVTGLVALFVGLVVVGNLLAFENDDRARVAAWLPGVAFVAVALTVASALIMYNRLKIVGQGAERAWSLIDVQLQRRADLVTALTQTVTAAADHERKLFANVARTRLPQRDDLNAATLTVESQSAELSKVWMLVESVPKLTTTENFKHLHDELIDTETRIAGARTFYNDAVTIMRDRARTFPGVVVARFVEMPPREHFMPEGFERNTPSFDLGR